MESKRRDTHDVPLPEREGIQSVNRAAAHRLNSSSKVVREQQVATVVSVAKLPVVEGTTERRGSPSFDSTDSRQVLSFLQDPVPVPVPASPTSDLRVHEQQHVEAYLVLPDQLHVIPNGRPQVIEGEPFFITGHVPILDPHPKLEDEPPSNAISNGNGDQLALKPPQENHPPINNHIEPVKPLVKEDFSKVKDILPPLPEPSVAEYPMDYVGAVFDDVDWEAIHNNSWIISRQPKVTKPHSNKNSLSSDGGSEVDAIKHDQEDKSLDSLDGKQHLEPRSNKRPRLSY